MDLEVPETTWFRWRQEDGVIEDPSSGESAFASPSPAAVLKVTRELTSDLAGNRDRNQVMQAIVQRTRLLLGADIADISRNDLAAGQTYVCYSDGVRNREFQTMRMNLGTGVLGLIAAGQPFAVTGDYLGDAELIHDPEIDRIVADEGVQAVAGVPLFIRGRVAGAFLVEHRGHAVLSNRGRSALRQLAAVASVTLDQILDAEQRAKERAEANRAHVSRGARLEWVEGLLAMDDALLPSLARAGNSAQLMQVVADSLGRPAALYSPSGKLLAGPALLAESVGLGCHIRLNVVARASISAGEPATLTSAGEQFTVVGLAAGSEHLGTVAVTGTDQAVSARLSRAAGFLTAALLVERLLIDVDSRPASMLIERLMRGTREDRSVGTLRRLAKHGIVDRGEVSVLGVLASEPGSLGRCLDAVRATVRQARGIASRHGDHLCVLVGGAAEPLGEELSAACELVGVPAMVGCATRRGSDVFTALPEAHDEAIAVAEAAVSLGFSNGSYGSADLGLAGLMMSGTDPGLADRLIDRFLGPILEYDRAHDTGLAQTAFQYFEHARHLPHTAAALCIHVSTLKKRLARLDDVCGPQWRVGPHAIDLHFALRLSHLRGRGATAR